MIMTKISKSEMELMQIIWEHAAPITSGEVLERLPLGRDWKNTTVLTFLSRLAEKGMVQVEKQGKANVYKALVSEKSYRGKETVSFLEDVHGGSVKSFMASLVDSNELTQQEIDELKDWLSKR